MAIFRKKHSTYLRDLSAYNAARDHMLTSGTYDDYYGEVLDSRGRVLEASTTPERPTSPPDVPHRKSRRTTSPPKSGVVPMVPPFQAIVAASGDAFTQELRARGQVWETGRIKNHLCVPRLNHDLTQEKAGNKILAFSEPIGIFAHASGQPVVRITLDTAAGTNIVSDSRLLRELHPYHGPSVYGIGSTATPVDTIGTLLLFNAPSLLLTSCHINVLSFAELRDHGDVILFHPDDDSFTICAPNDSMIRFNREGNHYVHCVRFVTTSPLPVASQWNTMLSHTTCVRGQSTCRTRYWN
jgi:hypothetical protein